MSVHCARTTDWYCAGTWSSTGSARAHTCEPTLRVDAAAPSDGRHCSAKLPNTT
ncbi:Uncharacterised protein [Mycobacteroides abscessus]|nr:Uncharacterised protein [Mycobacteroides abscessus]